MHKQGMWKAMHTVRPLRPCQLRTCVKLVTSFQARSWVSSSPFQSTKDPRSELVRACQCGQAEPHAAAVTGIQNLSALPSDKVEEVGKKNMQLRSILNRTQWPSLTCFEANGRMYDLPLRTSCADPGTAKDATLRLLAGFFDGDGCVSCHSNFSLSGCTLSVSQSFDQAEVLMLLRNTFGGAITADRMVGVGLCKPVLRWRVCGQSCRRAARLLAPHSITKQKQLLLAAMWPESKAQREECKTHLRSLKDYDSAVAGTCSWEYLAGFFDAEGCIHQRRGAASLSLIITQKYPTVLECLREFLEHNRLADVSCRVRACARMHELAIHSLPACKQVLHHLLGAGLLGKARQAALAVTLTRQNAASIRAELADLTGNQQFAKRLDNAGYARARRIKAARQQVACFERRGQRQEAESKQYEIEVWRHEHKLLNGRRENEQLLEYIRYIQSLHDSNCRSSVAYIT
ncbi:unnamed protein product [Symbiodinium sp. CCMP2456]|nr:unnamed protein product [Symbiodinium sp. CCMP2456]